MVNSARAPERLLGSFGDLEPVKTGGEREKEGGKIVR